MPKAYVGLGSNLQNPPQQVTRAIAALAQLPTTRLLAQSRLYRSAALTGPGVPEAQNDYCNAVCELETALGPQQLMQALLDIERAAGRVRDRQKWAPRILDLDLLHYQGVSLLSELLTLPHPGIAQRNFVLVPLAEITPALEIIGLGSVATLAKNIRSDGLEIYS